MSNYPSGVTGNEPQISGEWICGNCYGSRFDAYGEPCDVCKGTGILPEDVVDKSDTIKMISRAIESVIGNQMFDFIYDEDGMLSVTLPYSDIPGTGYLKEEF